MNNFIPETLHYHKFGHGPAILLAFHGIGQDGVSCFKSFADHLGDRYTIYAFDLYFHGKSIQPSNADFFLNNEVITKETWTKLIRDFLLKENISRFDVSLLYSG